MTTIAYRDGVLATDSQETDVNLAYQTVKLRRISGDLVAKSGCSYPGQKFFDWYAHRDTPVEFSEEENFECLIVKPNGRLFTVDRHLAFLPVTLFKGGFYAMGSGRDFALGAMRMGANAKEAIKIATEFDVGTGGKVQSLKIS